MRIVFVMPAFYRIPVGGYKIVYEYANRLTEMGHEISIVYCSQNSFKRVKMPLRLRNLVCNIAVKRTPTWFSLHEEVKQKCIPCFLEEYIPDADIIFATAVETADFVESLSLGKGKKFYLVQGYEEWTGTDEHICRTYGYQDMHKILVASWLKRYMPAEQRVTVIPNPIDTDAFYVGKCIEERNPYGIALLYHESPNKGVAYALETLERLKKLNPQLRVHMFGVPKRPEALPEWIIYTQRADCRQLFEIYNEASIFLCAAVQDGFGLTGAEAMACGCALVSTEYEGVKEYAVHMENALLSPVKDVDALIENIEKLWQDAALRHTIAHHGAELIKKNSWKQAITRMDVLFQEYSKEKM